jgi:hypothetical protein
MKRLILIVALVSTNAMALDFETEWAKFANDFAKLASKVNVKVDVDVPRVGNVSVPVEDRSIQIERVDPKSPDRLGLKLSDQSMVNKMKDLYKRDDVVVYSTTVR